MSPAVRTSKSQPKKPKASSSPKRAPRRRLPPAERRIQIVAAAKALFAAGGLERVTMRNIARRVGITQAAIYQHFEDKEAILFAIAEDFFSDLIADSEKMAAEATDPVDWLTRAMRSYVEVGFSHPDEYRLVFMTNVPGFERHGRHRSVPGQTLPIQPSKGAIAFGYLQDQVRDLIARGHIRPGDPELVAEAIWAAGHGLVSLMITHADFPWSREALIETQIRILLGGLLPEGSPMRPGLQPGKAPKA